MNSTLVDALGWALIHSLWQCAAIGILLAAANLALRRASANLRYILSYSALLAMPAAAVATFFALFSHDDLSVTLPPSMPVLSRIAMDHLPTASVAPSNSVPYMTIVVWFWLAGVVAMSVWSATGWFIAQRLKRRSKSALPEIWQSRLAALAAQLGIRRGIRLCESTLAQVPAVIGWIDKARDPRSRRRVDQPQRSRTRSRIGTRTGAHPPLRLCRQSSSECY
jgi:bla regulator protein BlaR1